MTDHIRDAYGFDLVTVRPAQHPQLGPCIDIGEDLTITNSDAPALIDAIRHHTTGDPAVEERVWLYWTAAVACSFAALELSMRTKLSAVLRKHLRIHPQRRGHRIAGAALVAGLAVFASHILDQHQEDHDG